MMDFFHSKLLFPSGIYSRKPKEGLRIKFVYIMAKLRRIESEILVEVKCRSDLEFAKSLE